MKKIEKKNKPIKQSNLDDWIDDDQADMDRMWEYLEDRDASDPNSGEDSNSNNID